jgi:hypothetical protein
MDAHANRQGELICSKWPSRGLTVAALKRTSPLHMANDAAVMKS